MTATVDYYFSIISTWAYLGHDAFVGMARRHGVAIRYKPVALSTVFPESGGLPLAKRHPLRQSYRNFEMRRWSARRGLPLEMKPAFFPLDPTLADCAALALADRPDVCGRYASTAMHGVWTNQNLADEATIRAHVAAAGADPDATLAAAKSQAVKDAYAANARDALAAGVFGSPTYVRDGELFWGQDRLDFLEQAIASGRPGYRA
jgi:2-hydroxychromene-2-carboxylate isomerase